MRLLQNADPRQKRAKTHAYFLGRPMCGCIGDYVISEGDLPTCKWCLVQLAVIPRTGDGKVARRGYNDKRTKRKEVPN